LRDWLVLNEVVTTCEGVAEEEEDSGCRPIIGLDGCHLKGVYGGQLLSAVGRAGNDNLFPIAMAVVEAKTKDSWTWFLWN
jgi:hypothetical protein